ncbi:LAETG motif-containing sortase-dependent surface protein [Kitasatospora sp. NPDC056651]|uniref:LAETG motif-containing sortase-dependent surface protein n=1 Tax=Kitasatospora sp. NPDC056651 TaxID=3345892 RepID=UPI0036812CF9
MRTPVISRFAKNDRALSGRRRIAVLAATAVLAGGAQLLATDTAWAATPTAATAPATAKAAATHHGTYEAGFHMTPAGQTITAGGPKIEIGVSVANFTGAPYQNVSAELGIFNPGAGGLRSEDLTIEVASGGGWKPVKFVHGGGDPSVFTVASPATTTARLEDGRAANFLFRVGLSAKASKETTELAFVPGAKAPGFEIKTGDMLFFHVAHAAAPAPGTKPTTPAKPKPTTPAKPAPTKSAEPAEPAKAAQPAADKTTAPAPAAEAPKASTPTAAPATTAPAGTPELAHTGSSSRNSFLALGSAALLALGAGVLIAVRRLRHQH